MSPGEDREEPRPPEYRVYRSRRSPLTRFRARGFRDPGSEADGPRARPPKRDRVPGRGLPGARPRLSRRRIVRWIVVWAVLWTLLSVALFAVSAQIQQTKLDRGDRSRPGAASNLITQAGTILVLGSDRRPEGSREPGADTQAGRADSILLLRVGIGKSAKLSVPRDSLAPIPGFATQKVNAAFALGGASLQTRAVEQFLGIKIDHVIQIDFEGFREFIDALGGVEIRLGSCVVSHINGGYRNGGVTLRLRPGKHTLSGRQALALARTRKNECNPREDDRTRARRQQLILAAVKHRLTSPLRLPRNFLFGPWLGWKAPRALISDMGGLTMTQFVLATITGGDSKPHVLRPSGPGPGGSLIISPEERRAEVDRFLRG